MAKRGRPKLNRPRVDYGTPESIRKRMHISPSDATLSSCPLDAVKSRRIISDEAYASAVYFASIRKRVFGKAIPPAMDLTAVSGRPTELDEKQFKHHFTEYRDACNAMKAQGRSAFDAIENLVIHERWPRWLNKAQGMTDSTQKHFQLGAAALLGWYKNKDRKAA